MAENEPTAAISIEAEEVELIPIDLIGKRYEIRPPKTSLAMKMAVEAKNFTDDPEKMLGVIGEWSTAAFGAKTAAKIQKRMDDPEDKLDIMHVMSLMEKIIERQTENPTS